MHRSGDLLGTPELDYDGFQAALRQDWGWYSPKAIEPKAFTGKVHHRGVCGFVAMDLTCNASRVERTQRDIGRDDMEHYYAALQVAGGSTIVQNDQVVKLGAGDVALVDSATPVIFASQDGYQYGQWFCLQLPRRSLISYLGFEPQRGSFGNHEAQAGRLLYQLVLGAIKDENSVSTAAAAYMRLVIYDLLGAMFAPSDPVRLSCNTDKLFTRVCSIIKTGFVDPDMSPGKVAIEAGISLRYLQKLFTVRGSTCSHYISSLRLEHAAQLLKRRAIMKTGQPLSVIAHACGFRDYTHFARGFRQRFGHTPGAAGHRGAPADENAL
jgi:AraC family transcriptional regulator, positive regulator of tynA and feaB